MQLGNVLLDISHTEVYFNWFKEIFALAPIRLIFHSGLGQWIMVRDSQLSFIYMQHAMYYFKVTAICKK